MDDLHCRYKGCCANFSVKKLAGISFLLPHALYKRDVELMVTL